MQNNGHSAAYRLSDSLNIENNIQYERKTERWISVKVLSEQQLKSDLPELKFGDAVKVRAKIKDQLSVFRCFEGVVVAFGINKTVTVRGVLAWKRPSRYTPRSPKFEVVRNGKVRRANLCGPH